MQAAAQRLPGERKARRSPGSAQSRSLPAGDDSALLAALPIAAAIIGRTADRGLQVIAHNGRFKDAVTHSGCTAVDWNDADCLKEGPISELLHAFFDGSDTVGELDFREGEGVSARYLRIKLAPLPARDSCLLSVVD